MTRILLRAHKSPFHAASATETVAKRLIGSNVGNLMFSQAAYRLLSTADAQIVTDKFDTLNPAEVNETADVLVVPLANAFRNSLIDGVDQMAQLFERVKVPIVVLGVGAQAPMDGEVKSPDLDRVVKRFMRAVLDHSPSIGVRGELTAKYLAGLGFGAEHVDIIGCPSMFLRGPEFRVTKKVEQLTKYSKISLNVSPYRPRIGRISMDHALRYPNLMYAAQDQRTLGLMLNGEFKAPYTPPKGTPTSLDHPLIRDNRVRYCLDPETWMEYLSTFDFSFGTRIHGTIAALLAETPAVLLAHDSRTLELAEYHSIPHRLLNDKSRIDAIQLYQEADWQPLLDGHAERWDRMSDFLAKHELQHVFLPGESPAEFDRQLAAVEFPRPVQMGMRHDLPKLYRMQREYTRVRGELKQAKAELADISDRRNHFSKQLKRGGAGLRRRLGALKRWMVRPKAAAKR